MDWTTLVWRLLCLLVLMSGLALCTPVWSILPTAIQAIGIGSALLVTLLIVVASFESSTGSSTPRAGSTVESGGPDE